MEFDENLNPVGDSPWNDNSHNSPIHNSFNDLSQGTRMANMLVKNMERRGMLPGTLVREPIFQVGDTVEIVSEEPSDINQLGDIGKVTEVHSNRIYTVNVPGKCRGGIQAGCELKLVTSNNSNKKGEGVMSIIKNLFKGKTQRATDHFLLTNGDGGLTPKGREEFIDFLFATDDETRKAFKAKILEAYNEEKKIKKDAQTT